MNQTHQIIPDSSKELIINYIHPIYYTPECDPSSASKRCPSDQISTPQWMKESQNRDLSH